MQTIFEEVQRGTLTDAVAARLLADIQAGEPGSARRGSNAIGAPDREGARLPIAIVGMECRLPGASSIGEFWSLLLGERSVITDIPEDRWALDESFYCEDDRRKGASISKSGGFVSDLADFAAELFGMKPEQARAIDVQQRLWLETSWRALRNAGLLKPAARGKTGIFVGARSVADILNPHPDAQGRERVVGTAQNYIAARAAQALDARGPVLVVDTACSSSLVGVHLACASLCLGECDVAVAGGVDVLVRRQTYEALTAARALAPDGRCKVFDAKANGYVPGEGAGAVVLKRLDDAIADGDRIHAVVLGSAINNDGYVMGATNPSVDGQSSVIEAALRRADIAPSCIGYVEAHGTGTEIGDPIEVRALIEAWKRVGSLPRQAFIGSVKSNIGHLHSAAGIAGLVKAVLCVKAGQIPRTLNISQVNPRIAFDDLPLQPARETGGWPDSEIRHAAVSAFGFGGTNAHIILRENRAAEKSYEGADDQDTFRARTPDLAPARLIAISAHSETALEAYRTSVEEFSHDQAERLDEVAYTACRCDADLPWRLAAIGDSPTGLFPDRSPAAQVGQPNRGTIFKKHVGKQSDRRIGFVFTGQGAQYVGMGRALYSHNRAFREAFDHVDSELSPILGESIRDLVIGAAASSAKLQFTRWTQPALFALQYALCAFWRSLGLHPACVLGHSVGEICAAVIAELLSLQQACALVAMRGKAMQDLCLPGRMVAVLASETDTRSVLDALQAHGSGDVADIAAVNAATNTVVAGSSGAVEQFCAAAQARGITIIPLRVSHAFHSRLVDPAAQALESVAYEQMGDRSGIDFFSSLSGKKLERLPPAYWADQVRGTVQFQRTVRAAWDAGIRHFLEIGPGDTLCRFIRSIVGDDNSLVLPSTSTEAVDLATTFTAAGRLWVEGYPILTERLAAEATSLLDAVPDYPFQRVNCGLIPARDHSHSAARNPTSAGDARPAETSPDHITRHVFRRSDAVMQDHTVMGIPVLPGVTWLEFTRQALCRGRDRTLRFSNVTFREPLVCSDDTPVAAVLSIKPGGAKGDLKVHISIDRRDGPTGSAANGSSVTCDVEADIRENSEYDQLYDITSVRRRCSTTVTVDRFYERIRARGIIHQDYYRSVKEIRAGAGEVLGRLELTETALAATGELALHPAILDAATTLGAALESEAGVWSSDSSDTFIPIHIERFTLYRPLPKECFCHYVERRNNHEVSAFDMTLVTAESVVLVRMEGFTSKRIRPEGARWAGPQTDSRSATKSLLRTLTWPQISLGSECHLRHVLILVPQGCPSLPSVAAEFERRSDVVSVQVLVARTSKSRCISEDDEYGLRRLFRDLAERRRLPDLVVLFGPQEDASVTGSFLPARALDAIRSAGDQLISMLRALEAIAHRPALRVVYSCRPVDGVQFVPDLTGACLPGMVLVLQQEDPSADLRLVGFDHQRLDAESLARELAAERAEKWIVLASKEVFVPRVVEVRQEPPPCSPWPTLGGHIVIAGGAGALGQALAVRLLRTTSVHITLIQRSGVESVRLCPALKAESERRASRLSFETADVSDRVALARALERGRRSGGPISAIVHAAGVADDALLRNTTSESLARCLSAKLGGAVLLDELTCEDPVNCFLIYSSTAAFRPGIGQAAYAGASSAADAFAYWRSSRGRRGATKVVNWTLWAGAGMGADPVIRRRLARSGALPLDPEEALDALAAALPNRDVRIIIDTARSQLLPATSGGASLSGASLVSSRLNTKIEDIIGKKLGDTSAPIDRDREFLDLGLSSTDLIDLADEISRAIGQTVHPTALFEHVTIDRLVRFLEQVHGASSPLASALIEPTPEGCSDGSAERPILFARDVRHRLSDLVGRVLREAPKDIDSDSEFLDLGLDSTNLIDLASQISDVLAVDLSPTALFEHVTINRLAEFISKTCRPRARHAVMSDGQEAASIPNAGRCIRDAAAQAVRAADIAITGYWGRFPKCSDPDELWNLICTGGMAVEPIPGSRWDTRCHGDRLVVGMQLEASKYAGMLENVELFDPLFFRISPREAEQMDPQQRLFLEVCWEAFRHAALTGSRLYGSNTGVFVGVMNNDYLVEAIRQDAPLGVGSGVSSAILANRVSYTFDLWGPSMPIETACSSGLIALHYACCALRLGECDQAVAGAVNLTLSPEGYVAFSRFGMLSPTGRCQTFSADADGYVRGEGAVAIILKRATDALRDGDTIHGIIRGSATGHNGRTNGISAPSPRAQADVVRRALQSAEVSADTISYVEAHGTGTSLGDPIEIEGLTRAFRQDTAERSYCVVGSIKPNIGHLEAASGLAGLVKVLLCLEHKKIPPTIVSGEINPALHLDSSPFRLARGLEDWQNRPGVPRRAGISSFGFGGANAHVILEEAPSDGGGLEPAVELGTRACAISAHSEKALRSLLHDIRTQEELLSDDDFHRLIDTLADNPDRSTFGCSFVVNGRAHFKQQLTRMMAAAEGMESPPDGIYRWSTRATRDVVFHLIDRPEFLAAFADHALAVDLPIFAPRLREWMDILKRSGHRHELRDVAEVRNCTQRRVAVLGAIIDGCQAMGLKCKLAYGVGIGRIAATYAMQKISASQATEFARELQSNEGSSLDGMTRIGNESESSQDDIELALPGRPEADRTGSVRERATITVDLLRFPRTMTDARAQIADRLCQLYGLGVPVALNRFRLGSSRRRIRLSAYPFDRSHLSVLKPAKQAKRSDEIVVPSASMPRLLSPAWREIAATSVEEGLADATLLVLCDDDDSADALRRCALGRWRRVVACRRGPRIDQLTPCKIDGEANTPENVQQFVDRLATDGAIDIVELLSPGTVATVVPRMLSGVHVASLKTRIRFWTVTVGAIESTDGRAVDQAVAAMARAVMRCAAQEHPLVVFGCLDCSEQTVAPSDLARILFETMSRSADPGPHFMRLQNHRVLVLDNPREVLPTARTRTAHRDQVWWILGGTGGLGRATAKHLAAGGAKVVISARRAGDGDDESPTVDFPCDVTKSESLTTTAAKILGRFGRIDGIVHAAGLPGGNKPVRDLMPADLERLLAVKMEGTLKLYRLARHLGIGRLVLFSSTSASYGGLHFGDYAAGNAFQSGFASAVSGTPRVQAIEWGAWEGIGLAATPDALASHVIARRSPLSVNEALSGLDMVLSDPELRLCLVETGNSTTPSRLTCTPPTDRHEPAVVESEELESLRQVVAGVLKIAVAAVSEAVPLWDIGADSRTFVEILQRYEEVSGRSITMTDALRSPTLLGIGKAAKTAEKSAI